MLENFFDAERKKMEWRMKIDDWRIVDVALRGVGATTPTSRRLRSFKNKIEMSIWNRFTGYL